MNPRVDTQTADRRLPEELVASSTFLLKRLGFAAKQNAMSAYDAAGISPYQFAILVLLDEEGVHETQASIADALGYDRGTLVGLLDELERQGLVERQRDPDDRRRHIVRVTADGRRRLGKLRRLAAQLEDEFLAPLDEDERRTLHELLLRLASLHEPGCAGPPTQD
jgi:DNA-binding MarR family transcriptional regulator